MSQPGSRFILGGEAEAPIAHSLIEAGGEASAVLMAAITRRIEELSPGQVLEVASRAATAQMDAVAWCHVTGHELLALLTDGDDARFWIRKRPAPGETAP